MALNEELSHHSAPSAQPQPLRFGAAGCWAWFHAAAPTPPIATPATAAIAAAPWPVLICGPMGAEDLAAHRTMRQLAGRLAAAGVPALRFDWPGQGDSALGLDPDSDIVRAARQALGEAIAALRVLTGGCRGVDVASRGGQDLSVRSGQDTQDAPGPPVVLVGLRLGATLALQMAAERDDVAACVAWTPVLSGRKFLRELRLLGGAALAPRERPQGGFEAGGFVYSAATCAQLQALDLATLPVRADLPLLVLDRADLPQSATWCERARAAGAPVTHEVLPGYDGLLSVAHRAVPPEALLARTVDWCRALPAHAAGSRTQAQIGLPVSSTSTPNTASFTQAAGPRAAGPVPGLHHWHHAGVPIAAEPVWLPLPAIGGSAPLFGVLTFPHPGAAASTAGSADVPTDVLTDMLTHVSAHVPAEVSVDALAVLLISSGAERRIGPAGLYAALARDLAAQGVTSLRLDLAGLGDSPAWRGAADNQVYSPQAAAQVGAAVACLRARPGVQRVAVLGLCSGAFHGFRAAVSGVRMDALLLLNPLLFFERPDMPLDEPGPADEQVQHAATQLLRALGDRRNWAKLLSGRSDLRQIGGVLVARLGLAWTRLQRRRARRRGRPLADDLVAEFERAADHASAFHFVFSHREAGLSVLQAEFGAELAPFLQSHASTLAVLPDADHTFSTEAGRAALARHLAGLLKT